MPSATSSAADYRDMGRKGVDGAEAVPTCTKQYHPDQASARLALKHLQKKAKPGAKAPVRVYPCEVCDGWHLTSKEVSGRKIPRWDLHPDWSRRTP